MKFVGLVTKLKIIDAAPVDYFFQVGEHSVHLNPLIGQKVSLRFTGNLACIACDRKIPKSYQQGYCFPCTQKLAQCDLCILKPQLCHYAQGTCREPAWGEQHCNIPHIVYLANTSGAKIGITKASNMLTRWFDQGAVQALPILSIKSRYHSGLIEVEIAKNMPDKTNWRKMLQTNLEKIDLLEVKEQILNTYSFVDAQVLTQPIKEIIYPGENYPKITALNFKDNSIITGTLCALKGQYMLFDHGVINVRNLTGYEIEIEY
jgi:hypothetical protein